MKTTILVADDSPFICHMTTMIVRNLGYQAITVSDGDACIDVIDTRHVDLLLLDINMPNKDGIEVLAYLRDHAITLPTIIFSGSSDLEKAVEALKMGAYDYLLKPVNPGRLEVTIKNALKERDLREQVRVFSAAMAQNPLSVLITDNRGHIEYSNPAFSKLSGFDEKELLGKKLSLISSGEHASGFYRELWKTIKSGRVWEGELVNRKKSGELFYEYTTISPITDQTGKISHYLAVKQDITQCKQAQEALAESDRRFQELAELLPQPIFECDTKGMITYNNRLGYELFGYTKADIEQGLSSIMLFVPEDRARALQSLEKRLKGIPYVSHEYTGQKKDGSKFPMLVYTASIERDGKPVGIRGIVLDITERRVIEQNLRQLNLTLEQRIEKRTRELETTHQQMILQEKLASIGQLSAGLAHELNNPINFLRLNFSTLEEDVKDLQTLLESYRGCIMKLEQGVDVHDELENVRSREKEMSIDDLLEDLPDIFSESTNGFDRIRNIIESMRNFSYRHAEKELVLFDINKGVRDTLVIARNEYRYVADVEEHFQEVPLLYCNPEQINQVFLNLIVNSAHAIASMQQDVKGRIVIRTWSDRDHVFFSIEDNGPGISPEVVRRVFEPFFTTKKPGHGTGLGLSISYDIVVHKHNGQLEVYSPPTGGTVFTVALPRNRSDNGESN